jgi:hypothetical protein
MDALLDRYLGGIVKALPFVCDRQLLRLWRRQRHPIVLTRSSPFCLPELFDRLIVYSNATRFVIEVVMVDADLLQLAFNKVILTSHLQGQITDGAKKFGVSGSSGSEHIVHLAPSQRPSTPWGGGCERSLVQPEHNITGPHLQSIPCSCASLQEP